MNTPVLEVTNLSKNFGGLRALNEVDLTINRQEIVALIGPNGAGKSTTFRMLCGLSRPTEGECFVAGMNLLTAGGAARAKPVSYTHLTLPTKLEV